MAKSETLRTAASKRTDLFVGVFAVLVVVFLHHSSDHKISLEVFSSYFGLFTCVIVCYFYSLKSAIIASLISSLGCFLFAPLVLDITHVSLLRPFIKMPFGVKLQPNMENMVHLDIRTYENLTMAEAKDIVFVSREPILFRGLIRDSVEKGQKIIDRVTASGQIFSMQRFETKPYDFFRGSKFTLGHPGTVADAMNASANAYISFEPLMTKDEVVDILDSDLHSKFVIDNSFISNFTDTVVTTFVHGAPAAMSWSVQMIGHKTWFLWDPSIVQHMNGGWFCRVSVPSLGDEAELFSHPAIKVTVGPGDVLVFPPLFYHTVITHHGPNLMLNIRTRFGNWLPSAIPAFRFSAAVLLSKIFGPSNPHYMHGIRLLRKLDIEAAFDESPEALRWEPVEKFI